MKVGNNPITINRDAVFELESTNKGMLLPRVALTATNNVAPLTAHVVGMVVYNTATAGTGTTAVVPGYYYNNGSGWLKIAQEGSVNLASLSLSNATTPAGNSVGQIAYNTNATSGLPVGPVYWDGTTWVAINPSASINLYNSNGTLTGARTVTQGVNALTFDGAGNFIKTGTGFVGIGTPSPLHRLHVDDGKLAVGASAPGTWTTNGSDILLNTGVANSQILLRPNGDGSAVNQFQTSPASGHSFFGSDGFEKVRIMPTGNVGIGMTTPTSKLYVRDNVDAYITIDAPLDKQNGVVISDATNGTDWTIYRLPNTRDLSFWNPTTGSTMVMSNSGNVGIGTTTPTSKFQVNGSIATAINNSATNVTLTDAHNTLTVDLTAGNVTVTLPAANTCGGRIYHIVRTDGTSNELIFSAAISLGNTTFTTSNIPGATFIIQSDGTNWRLINN